MAEIAVMGGGIAGCTTALELARHGHKVIIFEQKKDLLQGTSSNTPGRMGLGYHYFDSDTAKRYMKQTVEFMKHYSDCFLGDNSTPHLQNGRYFVVKDSLVSLQELMAGYDEISLEFEKICQEDKSNSIFGTVHLHRTLHESEFQKDINLDKVSFAIETKERLLDWQKFGNKLKTEISNNPNIGVKLNSKIKETLIDKTGKFAIVAEGNLINESRKFDYVINCTWQNIEYIDEQLGIGSSHYKKDDPKESMTSRLKLLAEVELPDNLKNKPSMFFCVGPHAMFSNLGDGIGRITYAPVTNFGTTTESKMSEQFEKWLTNGLTEEETKEYGQKIIDGVTKYIPDMKDAKLIKVIPGIVKSRGSVDIEDKNSPFHKRDYNGVEEQQIGWIDNAAMKLFYCLGNAKEVKELIKKQELAKNKIKLIIESVLPEEPEESEINGNYSISEKMLTQFFINHLQRNFKANDFAEDKATKLIAETIKQQVKTRGLILKEVKQLSENFSNKIFNK